MKSRTFLVVDDSLAMIKRLTMVLEGLGHRVIGSALDGREAIAKVNALRPEVVTMDIQMPEMDGLEATRQILREQPDLPIIIVTAHGQESTVVDAIGAGARHFIAKPIETEKVRLVLNKVFADD